MSINNHHDTCSHVDILVATIQTFNEAEALKQLTHKQVQVKT